MKRSPSRLFHGRVASLPLFAAALSGLLVAAGAASPAHAQYTAPSRIGGRVATRGDGTIVIFTRATNNSVHFAERIGFTGAGGAVWPSWFPLGGFLRSQPVAVMNADSRMLVVGRGSDDKLWQRREDSARSKNFTEWAQLPHLDGAGAAVPLFKADPILVRTDTGRVSAISVAADGSAWESRQSSSGGVFGRYVRIGKPSPGLFGMTPVVSLNATGGLILFAIGGDRAVWFCTQPASSTSWSSWSSLGIGVRSSGADAMAIGVNANGRVSLFINNTAATVSYRTQTTVGGTSFSPWVNLPGGAHGASRPAVMRNSDGRLSVFFFANGGGGTSLAWQSQTSANANTWSNWVSVHSPATSSPVAINDVNGRIHLFALGNNDMLSEVTQTVANGTTFTPWANGLLGGPFLGF